MAGNAVLVAGIVLAAAFVAAVLSSIRALYAFCDVIREKHPDEWASHSDRARGMGLPQVPAYTGSWIAWLIWGTAKLDLPDDDYRRLLRTTRVRLLVCLILFVICLIGLGWFTQGTAH